MQREAYGEGANGPGHCFHQHITFYLRAAGGAAPPASAFPDYVLLWDDLWPALSARRHLFNAAAEHFARYTETTGCFERFGLEIERQPFGPHTLIPDIQTDKERGDVRLAAVDPYYLPSFVEHGRAHGLAIAALLDAAEDGEQIALWHWENSAHVHRERIALAIQERDSKLWRLHLRQAYTLDRQAVCAAARKAHEALACAPVEPFEEASRRLQEMAIEDPPLPADAQEQAILFHAPYQIVQDGNFRTLWLLRATANRMLHMRGTLEELFAWAGETPSCPQALALAQQAHEAGLKWKTLNILCARYELRALRTLPPLLLQQLEACLAADQALGLACKRMDCA